MTVSHTASCLCVTLVLVAAGACSVQAQTAAGTPPRVGQPGKDVIWVPSPDAMVNAMLTIANVTPRDIVMDLGSGDGKLVLAAAKRGAQAIGVEFDPQLVELSKRKAAEQGVAAKTTFIKGDLFTADLSRATVILLFLRLDLNLKLRPKLLETRPGTRVVSNTFTMGDWEPDDLAVVHGDCVDLCSVMEWIVPARVEGAWTLADGTLMLSQEFQAVGGTLRSRSGAAGVTNGRLAGDQITFTVNGAIYRARVEDGSMTGTVTRNGRTDRWIATRRR